MPSTAAKIHEYTKRNGRLNERNASGNSRYRRNGICRIVQEIRGRVDSGECFAVYVQRRGGLNIDAIPVGYADALEADATESHLIGEKASTEAILSISLEEASEEKRGAIVVFKKQTAIVIKHFFQPRELMPKLKQLEDQALDLSKPLITPENINEISKGCMDIVEENRRKGTYFIRRAGDKLIRIAPDGTVMPS